MYSFSRYTENFFKKNEPNRNSRLLQGIEKLKIISLYKELRRGDILELLRAIETNHQSHNNGADELVARYGEAVYKFCRSLTYTKEDADDLFQETFVKAFVQLSKTNSQDNPQGFLFSIAIYLWKRWKQKYARRNRIAPNIKLDDMVASDFDVWRKFAEQEEIRIVRELVAGLPEKHRIPIVLFYTAELSVSEIASALNIPVGTVKSRLHKARNLIEKGLVKNGYGKPKCRPSSPNSIKKH
jgi:RNA polymerase sigma-70 factor (ECF subfamily)